jgi:hypothetical protein
MDIDPDAVTRPATLTEKFLFERLDILELALRTIAEGDSTEATIAKLALGAGR